VAGLISIIIPTYNRAEALQAVLRSLARQSDQDFEVLVADDGSKPDTAAVVAKWNGRIGRRVVHVWQPHKGFRAAEIRNRAILAAAGDYCIFLDGDCLAQADFVTTHRRLAEPGWFVTGNRILLSRALTEAVLAQGLPAETWSFAELVRHSLHRGVNRLLPALRLPLGRFRKLLSGQWRGAQSCNLAVARADLDRVDGFDTSYTGWGLEDSDLVVRLLRADVRRKDGRFAVGVLHLWHAPNDRSGFTANQVQLNAAIHGSRVRAVRGMSALANVGDTQR
jgi:glycosyltransferase involved in cell wall biosynthesis